MFTYPQWLEHEKRRRRRDLAAVALRLAALVGIGVAAGLILARLAG